MGLVRSQGSGSGAKKIGDCDTDADNDADADADTDTDAKMAKHHVSHSVRFILCLTFLCIPSVKTASKVSIYGSLSKAFCA